MGKGVKKKASAARCVATSSLTWLPSDLQKLMETAAGDWLSTWDVSSNWCVFPLLGTGKVKQEPTVYREGPPYQRRGSLQLWQFLVTLLDDPANAHFIAWTGRGMEFKLIEPEEVKEI